LNLDYANDLRLVKDDRYCFIRGCPGKVMLVKLLKHCIQTQEDS